MWSGSDIVLAQVDKDGAIDIDGRLIDAFRTASVVTCTSFSPTGDFLATADIDSGESGSIRRLFVPQHHRRGC
ncbi:hypothetical protein BGW80DRAFT_657940 [Lactifluus volemus]|nr:hypothetical protein BGW80DRAFT_657940 [Lactifluus volemus]